MGTPAYILPIMGKSKNRALDFDGVDEYLSIPDSNVFTFPLVPFSTSSWIYADSNIGTIVEKFPAGTGSDEYILGFYSDNLIYWQVNDSITAGRIGRLAPIFSLSAWHMVTATYDGGTLASGLKIFIDAVQVDNANNNSGVFTTMRNTTQPLGICRPNNAFGAFNGKNRRTTMWNIAMSLAQIQEEYNSGTIKPLVTHSAYANVIDYWDMGSNLSDAYPTIIGAKAGNNAIMQNMETSDFVPYP